MKLCQICSHLSENDAPHCIHCGEASWLDIDPVDYSVPELTEDEKPTNRPGRGKRTNG